MSISIDLTKIDNFMLKRIVLQMSPESGCRLYRTCRAMEQFIKSCKPLWTLNNSKIQYSKNQRTLEKVTREGEENLKIILDPIVSLKNGFVRIPSATVGKSDSSFLDSVVLPELKKMRRLDFLTLNDEISAEQIERIIEAVRPKALTFYDDKIEWNSPCFEGVRDLSVYVHNSNVESYLEDKTKIFEMAQNRQSVSLNCPLCYRTTIVIPLIFLQTWLKGHSVGTLQILTIRILEEVSMPIMNMIEIALDDPAIRKLMKSCTKMERSGFVIERQGGEAVTLQCSFDEIAFLF